MNSTSLKPTRKDRKTPNRRNLEPECDSCQFSPTMKVKIKVTDKQIIFLWVGVSIVYWEVLAK